MLAARVLAGRSRLPALPVQEGWERARIAEKGDGPAFTVLNPEFEAYFEEVRALAGEPGAVLGSGSEASTTTVGRRLPPFQKAWVEAFDAGHRRRIRMWERANLAGTAVLPVDGHAHLEGEGETGSASEVQSQGSDHSAKL